MCIIYGVTLSGWYPSHFVLSETNVVIHLLACKIIKAYTANLASMYFKLIPYLPLPACTLLCPIEVVFIIAIIYKLEII